MEQKKKRTPALLWTAALFATMVLVVTLTSALTPRDSHMPEAEGKAVWDYIMEEDPYTEWDQWPGHDGMHEGQSPHGAYLKLYVNDVAKSAINNGKAMMPDNALIVKENYDKNKELVALTPMYKVNGYNPDAGNWFWAKYGKNGRIAAEGKVGSCIDCHKKAGDHYLFSMNE